MHFEWQWCPERFAVRGLNQGYERVRVVCSDIRVDRLSKDAAMVNDLSRHNLSCCKWQRDIGVAMER